MRALPMRRGTEVKGKVGPLLRGERLLRGAFKKQTTKTLKFLVQTCRKADVLKIFKYKYFIRMYSSQSSQELNEPLSQETLMNTLSSIPKEIFESFMKNNFTMEVDNSEMSDPKQIGELMASIQIPNMESSQMQSSIPVTENLPGFYDFNILHGPDDTSKKCRYTFSPVTNKLYVRKDSACPFSFSTNERLDGFTIRAMLYFSSPENRLLTLERCLCHIRLEQENGDIFYKHFIRSLSKSACYYEEPNGGRRSVTVNYENPSIGESYTTYLFKFMCYTSCAGGPNRRPMCVVFTLEKNGIPYGRCKVELKVCSDPKRDRTSDEEHLKRKESFPHLFINPNQPSTSVLNDRENLNPKNNKVEKSDKCFLIKASDKDEYNYLRCVQRFYHMNKLIKTYNWTPTVPDMKKLLRVLSSNSYEGSD